jgi:3-oxoacyl-[acyl-carrier-protein] synthase II
MGLLGGFGCGTEDFRKVLASGSLVSSSVRFPLPDKISEINVFLANTESLSDYVPKRNLRRIDHYSKMALLGSYLALEDAGIIDGNHRKNLGVIIASGYGSTRTIFSFLDSVMDDGDALASPTHFSHSVHNAAAAHVAMKLKAMGPNLTISQFEMSMPIAFLTALHWLATNRVDTILVGGVDEYCNVIGYCHARFDPCPSSNTNNVNDICGKTVLPVG